MTDSRRPTPATPGGRLTNMVGVNDGGGKGRGCFGIEVMADKISYDDSKRDNNNNNNNDRFTSFVRDYPGDPVPEETLTHPPSWSSCNLYQLLPSITIHSLLFVQITCLAIFLHNLFSCPLYWSTSWSEALHLIFHTFLHPISLLFSQERVASQIKTLANIAAPLPLTLYNLPQRYDPSKRLH